MEAFHRGRKIEIDLTVDVPGSWHAWYKVWPTTDGTGEPKMPASLGITAQSEDEAYTKALNEIMQLIDGQSI